MSNLIVFLYSHDKVLLIEQIIHNVLRGKWRVEFTAILMFSLYSVLKIRVVRGYKWGCFPAGVNIETSSRLEKET